MARRLGPHRPHRRGLNAREPGVGDIRTACHCPAQEGRRRKPRNPWSAGLFRLETRGFASGTPNGIRTRAATLRGWCPRPLDDGGLAVSAGGRLAGRSAPVRTGFRGAARTRLGAPGVLCDGFLPPTGSGPRPGRGLGAPGGGNDGFMPEPVGPGRGTTKPQAGRPGASCEVARGGGLEPPITGPEPDVLPITPPPNGRVATLVGRPEAGKPPSQRIGPGAGCPTSRGRWGTDAQRTPPRPRWRRGWTC